MSEQKKSSEKPTMEEIVSSVRKIITEDENQEGTSKKYRIVKWLIWIALLAYLLISGRHYPAYHSTLADGEIYLGGILWLILSAILGLYPILDTTFSKSKKSAFKTVAAAIFFFGIIQTLIGASIIKL